MTLSLMVTGCIQFSTPKGNGFAVEFSGKPSCIEAETHASYLPDPEDGFTVEAWVQSNADTAYQDHPLVVWNGAFALWSGQEGTSHFTDSSTEPVGADGANGWMDGELHHVAGTYSSGIASLFLDGQKIAFNTNMELGSTPTSSIFIGCWADTDLHHEGLIDEVRISNTVRYSDDFTPSSSAFGFDLETIHLWHFDEGENDVALDEAGLADAYLSRVDWVEFSLSGDDTAER